MKSALGRILLGKLFLLIALSILWSIPLIWGSIFFYPIIGEIKGSVLAAATETGAYTPPAGSPERRAIVEALRQELRSRHNIDAIFKVQYLKVRHGWAWIFAYPGSPDGRQNYEGVFALLRKAEGGWQVAEFPCTEEDNPACVGHAGYFEKLKARFPKAPPEIFPE